ncbi:uncharacterized protein N7459_002675 [Penicillium hispanicum]|uniref:uncharacterized protein n=1 Tax=Penicillium hispanicum TaxID=1080232 RepID=UPI002540AF72|nr:uncharacterized protein N7459_002675 [Penicillium hispanicum]KAJ5586910.1 hypothetical protein N7459_002675 [Penicillium hispanicum]
MYILASTLLALPIILVVSIPLILSAWITIFFALVTLFLRLAVVYTELGYALLVNFLSTPISSSSLSAFTESKPPTPVTGASRRSSAYGLIKPRISNDSLSSWAINGSHDDSIRRQQKIYARSMVEAHYLPSTSTASSGFPVSGDERRDFEGVGGWRSYSSNRRGSHPHENLLSSTSSSSIHSVTGNANIDPDAEADADERAWLSLNHRLELPSQLITIGAGSAPSTANSPINMDSFDHRSAGNFHAFISSSAPRFNHNQNSKGQRHHRRSHTTSSLMTTNVNTGTGLFFSSSSRPDHASFLTQETGYPASPPASRLAPFMTPQPYSSRAHTQARPFTRANSLQINASLSNSMDGIVSSWAGSNHSGGAGGYFSLQRPRVFYTSSRSAMASPSSSGYITPATGALNDARDAPSLQLARLVADYPTSFGRRRRSIAGPHSRESTFG